MKQLLVIFLLFLLPGWIADQQGDQLLGRWVFPSKGSSMDIYRTGNHYFARVAEVDKAGEKNYGLVKDNILIRNLAYDGEAWSNGELVHPKTGMRLSVEVEMNHSQMITVTVYKGFKMLHKKFTMTRKTS